ncbi:hypothetical protein WH87_08245 [Devosia epidermidihirudinis]|uniref:GDP-L-fucose synthase n=1 Tax=Devosia epidermidihirudinis TaxID=1293439 RepID=A0A0F5QD18_9HYPH|nr:GDP-L-fucose synthase [Devosia epidermidihirudinis]KKC38860.1 hypothetical protein WH87_08245 [Devosia epidermidihirudinis]
MFDLRGRSIWIAGHRGMVGSALVRRLAGEGCTILTAERSVLDLTRQGQVEDFLAEAKPDAIVLAAARVGGIHVNDAYPADFLAENLAIETNVIAAAHRSGVDRLLFLGSSCIYPKLADQPIREDALLTGPLEPTNEWYALAKIAGLKLASACRKQYGRNYIAAMPTNLYGPGDNFDLSTSHVVPALMRKAHEARLAGARQIKIWGTGTPRREFLHVDDCADALVFLLKTYAGESHINVGFGQDISILALTELICGIVGFEGRIVHDLSKPDGTPRKLLDSSRLRATGWAPKLKLRDGLAATYAWFLEHQNEAVAA